MKSAIDIDKEAAAWVVRREAAKGSVSVEAELEAWIDVDARHRAAFVRLSAAWDGLRIVERLRPVGGPVDRHLLAPQKSFLRSWLPRPLHAVAAACLLLAVFFIGPLLEAVGGKTYSTGVGDFERIRLEDGSSIELNTDSEVRVRMNREHRLVTLRRGEANFKVAHDRQRPFDVDGGGVTVRAVGTAFAVRLRDGEQTEVVVTEGRVVVAPPDMNIQAASTSLPLVVAGEVATVRSKRLVVEPVQVAVLGKRLAWLEGKLVLEEETLAEAVAEFNRYNRTRLVVADPQLAGLRVGGTFEVADVPSFLSALERVFGIRAYRVDDDVVQLMSASWDAAAGN